MLDVSGLAVSWDAAYIARYVYGAVKRMHFDLTGEAKRFARQVAFVRIAAAIALAAVLITVGDQLVTGILQQADPEVQVVSALIVAFLGSVAGFVAWAVFLLLSPSATSVDVDSHGVVLRYGRGRPAVIDWTSPKLKLRMRGFSKGLIGLADESRPDTVALFGPFGKFNRITVEVLHAILGQAHEIHLTIKISTRGGRSGTAVHYVITH